MIRELLETDTDVFSVKPGRQHRNFAKFTCNTMKKVNKKKMREWINKQLKILVEVLAMKTASNNKREYHHDRPFQNV